MSRLHEIFATRARDLEIVKHQRPLAVVRREAEEAPLPRDFLAALRSTQNKPAIIAEIKRASPSRGVLYADLDALTQARRYMEGGAVALSVLTEPRFFQGNLADLLAVAGTVPLPVLRKDFILDPYQIYEARAAGADAVLLIASYLEEPLLRDLMALANTLGMVALVEVHTLEDLERAWRAGSPRLIGINNRDLHDFSVDLKVTLTLRPYIPPEIQVVAESGIHTSQDLRRLRAVGITAFLVGEALVRAEDPIALLRDLCSGGPEND